MKKTLDQIQKEFEERRLEEVRRNQEINNEREKSRIQWLQDMNMKMYEKSSFVPSSSSSSSGGSHQNQSFSDLSVSINDWTLYDNTPQINSITIEITSDGSNPPSISERGIVYGLSPDPSLGDVDSINVAEGGTDIGEFTMNGIDVDEDFWYQQVFIRAYVVSNGEVTHSLPGLSPKLNLGGM